MVMPGPPKPLHHRNSSQQPGLPLSRYGSPGLPSCQRANAYRQPGRPDFLQFPRHLLWLPNKLPLCPPNPGCECLCCGDRACHPLSSGYSANTGWASVEFTNSSLSLSLTQAQCEVQQGRTTCCWANRPSGSSSAIALLNKVATPRSWRGGEQANGEGDMDPGHTKSQTGASSQFPPRLWPFCRPDPEQEHLRALRLPQGVQTGLEWCPGVLGV